MIDENTFVTPDAWRDALHPRRDRPLVPPAPAVDGTAPGQVRSLLDDAADEIEHVIGLPGTAPEIADAVRAQRRGAPNPLGAIAVAEMARAFGGGRDRLFVDAWIAEHGVAFAAAAFAEMHGIRAMYRSSGLSVEWTGFQWRRADDMAREWGAREPTARRLRAHLAAAPDAVYEETVAGLAERRGHAVQRQAAAYLAPTREDWVEELCADPATASFDGATRWLLFCALGRPHQPAALGLPLGRFADDLGVLATLIDGVGAEAVVPMLAEALDVPGQKVPTRRTVLGVLAGLPLDSAFQALVDRLDHDSAVPALVAASDRFPVRALRLLPWSGDPRAVDLLAGHVRTHPELVAETLPALPAGPRQAIREILDADVRLPPAADVPPLLTEPPWTRPGTRTKPVVIKDLPSPGTRAITWEPGERADWASRKAPPMHWARRHTDHEETAAAFAEVAGVQRFVFVLDGPEELVRPLLPRWDAPTGWEPDQWMRVVVARYELDVHDAALFVARSVPAEASGVLLPLLSDEIARTMADWLARRRKNAEKTARAWFRRHGPAAVPALLPDALGKAGPARRAAEAALRLIAERDGREPIVEAARVHGDRAAAAIETLLTTDPLEILPAKIPAVPDWADVRVLPQLLLRGRTHALPDDAARHVLTMFALSNLNDVYAGLRTVLELCDPGSVTEFGWALFQRWEWMESPATESWAFTQLALTGDDETVRRLTPLIRAWPGKGGHTKAVTGLDVLAAIGSETALMHLHSISQRVKFKGLKTKAQEKIEEVAAGLDLTTDQLADRLVPDFELDASGTLTLDYGPRRFVIGFDERLRPTVADEDGTPRKSLPKPGAKDDPELAPAASKRFAALKKDVRTVASDQVVRLEQAMVTERRWPLAEFREFLAGHPLVGHLVRRLVWQVCSPGQDGPAFRVAEDGTLADADDDTVTIPEDARVRIAHPVHLGENAVRAWSEVFADYTILQPFAQLARPVRTLAEDERTAGRLTRFEGAKVPPRAVLGLVNRGWERVPSQAAGVEDCIFRRVAADRHIVVGLEPGIDAGDPGESGEQTLADILLAEHPDRFWGGEPTLVLGDLDPVTVSEVLADLTALTQEASR